MGMILGPFFRLTDVENALRTNFSHSVIVCFERQLRPNEISEWCFERFGINAKNGDLAKGVMVNLDRKWSIIWDRIYFREKKHAFEFKLTWG
jgi:hypothetical protein